MAGVTFRAEFAIVVEVGRAGFAELNRDPGPDEQAIAAVFRAVDQEGIASTIGKAAAEIVAAITVFMLPGRADFRANDDRTADSDVVARLEAKGRADGLGIAAADAERSE